MGEKDLKRGDKRRDLQQPTVKSHLFNITPLLLDRLGGYSKASLSLSASTPKYSISRAQCLQYSVRSGQTLHELVLENEKSAR